MEESTSTYGNDEIVVQFLAFTNTEDPEQAASYLEMSGGNVETAVGLYMEHNIQGAGVGHSSADLTHDGVGNIAAAVSDQDEIRAPDEVRTMRLMDYEPSVPGMMTGVHGMHSMLHDEISQFMPPANQFPPSSNAFFDPRAAINLSEASTVANAGVDNIDDNNNDDDDDDDDSAVVVRPPSVSSSARSQSLSDLFAPPIHLIHNAGGFQGARSSAKDSRRWLLVNLQSDSDFACHALNRDVWSDELVDNLVREGFIFWQAMDSTPDGMTYVQRYNVQAYPHIAIIDPRTGRLMWRKEGWTQENPLTAEMFVEQASDFCSKHTFDKPPSEPSNRYNKRPIDEMSEEQQLQAAIRESMSQSTAFSVSSYGELGTNGDHNQSNESNGLHTQPKEVEKSSMIDELLQFLCPTEPLQGKPSARVQIRMPDGSRVVRKFSPDLTVKSIFAFVAQSNDDIKKGKQFELFSGYPPRNLFKHIDESIQSCSLNGESITVRWTT